MFSFQGGVAIGHTQGTTSTGAMLPADLLGAGYGVMWSSGTRTSTHYDLQVGGETALMVKERFVERHGVPVYTVAVGGSGGAIQQYVYGQNHPGLIDAGIPQYSYSDMVTQTIHVGDCELLEHYFDVVDKDNPKWKDPEVRQQIIGLNGTNHPKNLSAGEIAQWNGLYQLYQLFGYQVMDRDPASPAPALMECKPGWFGLTPLVLNPTFTDVDDIDKLAQGTEGVEWTHFGRHAPGLRHRARRVRPPAMGQRRRAVRTGGACAPARSRPPSSSTSTPTSAAGSSRPRWCRRASRSRVT